MELETNKTEKKRITTKQHRWMCTHLKPIRWHFGIKSMLEPLKSVQNELSYDLYCRSLWTTEIFHSNANKFHSMNSSIFSQFHTFLIENRFGQLCVGQSNQQPKTKPKQKPEHRIYRRKKWFTSCDYNKSFASRYNYTVWHFVCLSLVVKRSALYECRTI